MISSPRSCRWDGCGMLLLVTLSETVSAPGHQSDLRQRTHRALRGSVSVPPADTANLLPAETSVTLSPRVKPAPPTGNRKSRGCPRAVVSMTRPSDSLARLPVGDDP